MRKAEVTSSFHGTDGRLNFKNVFLDLMVAGSDTTACTLKFAMLIMIKYPEVQKKMREELAKEFGSAVPDFEDADRTPFTQVPYYYIYLTCCRLIAYLLY